MKKYAFFDFDQTIYGGYTYEDFINYVSDSVLKDNKYRQKLKNIPKQSMGYNEIVLAIASIVGEIIVGWDNKRFVNVCRRACSREKVLDWVFPVTKYLKSEGFENIIITASFFEMISDSLEAIEIDRSFCSLFETENGKYTGKINLLLNNDKKLRVIQKEISQGNSYSVAFGDSIGDAPMLDSCEMAFLVRSYDADTEKLAKESNWNIGSNPNKIIEKISKGLHQFR